jgi:predicted RND superfamily exporter protein
MWQKLAKFVLKNKLILLIALVVSTIVMGYFASKVKLSYEFSRAIPVDNIKYQENANFKKIFGEDGNMLVIGVQTNTFFSPQHFSAYQKMGAEIKKVHCVENVLSVPDVIMLVKDSLGEKFIPQKIFALENNDSKQLENSKNQFLNLPFYKTMLYNADSGAYLMAVKINKDSMNSPARVAIVNGIIQATAAYEKSTGVEVHLSGLPLIRTVVAERVKKEMNFFLWGSLLLSTLILLLFFRSFSTAIISLSVVMIGVIWTVALIYLCGYKITLLTALIPSLVVVIGIPNCVYFINKYHTSYLQQDAENLQERKHHALIEMVSKMGVVTLFCNITAAIGFAVFAFTKSAILKEFGVVSGISIMLIFVISFILLPSVLSYLPSPKKNQLKYLDNKWIITILNKIEAWIFTHTKFVWITTGLVVLFSIVGILKLKSVGFIVDDLPKTDKVYLDLKFFEKNFKGIMPLEIMVDTKKRRGVKRKGLSIFNRIDSLSMYIASQKEMNRPLNVSEGLKFATQAFYDNDSMSYRMPSNEEGAIINDLIVASKGEGNGGTNMLNAFIDSSSRYTRISVNMADIGTERLPKVLADIQEKANQYFDTSYQVTLTGTSITFLEGSKFIINGLKESIFWAFVLIALCMLYLFRSFKMLIVSLLPNIIPLMVTAGVMGWVGVPLKPSTVLVFSVALGIAVDITIRFLVNYRQILPMYNNDVEITVKQTLKQTGLSIIYTSLVLMAGFIIFCGSSFGGTFALGWLTSITLLVATITNLIFLPVLLVLFNKKRSIKTN